MFLLDRVKGWKNLQCRMGTKHLDDELLKKEIICIEKAKPHPIMIKHNLNFVPYQHENLDIWKIL